MRAATLDISGLDGLRVKRVTGKMGYYRLKGVLGRKAVNLNVDAPMPSVLHFGRFELDLTTGELRKDARVIGLPPQPFKILALIANHPGKLVTREEIQRHVWAGETFVDYEGSINHSIKQIRMALGDDAKAPRYVETLPTRGYRFIAPVESRPLQAVDHRLHSQESLRDHFEPVGGAVPLESKFYIVRRTDSEFRSAIARQDSIVLVKGARQVGKTSLLARGLQTARAAGARVVVTDFQTLAGTDLASVEKLFLSLAGSFADQLDLEALPDETWNTHFGPSTNFARYLRRTVLSKIPTSIVWGLDEVDRLFSCAFASEVFGLFRAWHNERALDPQGPWHRFTLAIAYATEAHLFITDLNQSPFNVGTRLTLEDFSLEQVAELNSCYECPLHGPSELERYFRLVGGHPYLVRQGLHEMAAHRSSLSDLEAQGDQEEGPFGDHLRRIFVSLTHDPSLSEAMRRILQNEPCPSPADFYRLRSVGVISGDSAQDIRPRCRLYAKYLARHLL